MQRIAVASSDIVSIGYDPKTNVLEIEFKEQRIYQYLDVEPDVYERFMRADSFGEFFYAFINRRYRYKRIKETNEGAERLPLAFVTGNANKVRELRIVCEQHNIEVEQLELPVDEIQSDDPERVAVQKAKEAYRLARRPVLVMDAFWNILALHGFPGAYMSDITKWLRAEDFLALMADKKDRTIGCIETLVYYDGKRPKVFSESRWGKVVDAPRGKSALSFRQIVIMDGDNETIAQLEERAADVPKDDGLWHDFVKWYAFQRRVKQL